MFCFNFLFLVIDMKWMILRLNDCDFQKPSIQRVVLLWSWSNPLTIWIVFKYVYEPLSTCSNPHKLKNNSKFCLRGREDNIEITYDASSSQEDIMCPRWCSEYVTEDTCSNACHNLTRYTTCKPFQLIYTFVSKKGNYLKALRY